MDKVTRPSWAARRASGSRSASISAGETSDDSLPSSAKASDGESQDSEVEILPARTPDPRATRRSKRAEANKAVDYSRKHHPQDYALPGYQHKARLLRRAQKSARKLLSPELQSSPQPEDVQEKTVLDSEDDAEDLEQDTNEVPEKAPSKPRKRLRIRSDDRSSPQQSMNTKRSFKSANEIERVVSRSEDAPMEDTGVYADYSEGAIKDQQPTSSDDVGAAKELNGVVDAAQDTSSSEHGLSDMLAAKAARSIAGVSLLGSDDGNYVVDNEDSNREDESDNKSNEGSRDSDTDEGSEADHEHDSTHDNSNSIALNTDAYESSTMFQQEPIAYASTQRRQTPLWERQRGGTGESDGAGRKAQPSAQIETIGHTGGDPSVPHSSTLKVSERVGSISSASKASSRVSSRDELEHHHSDLGMQTEVLSRTQTAQHKTLEVKTPAAPMKASAQLATDIYEGPSTAASILTSRHATFGAYLATQTGPVEAGLAGSLRSNAITTPEPSTDRGREPTTRNKDGKDGDGEQVSPLTSAEDSNAFTATSEDDRSSTGQDLEPDAQRMTAANGPSQMARESSRMSLQSLETPPQRPANGTLPSQMSRKDKLLSSDPSGGPPMMNAPRSDHTEFTSPSSPSNLLQVWSGSDHE